MRCTVTGEHYTVYGYGGKQVRDNIHSADLVRAFAAFHAEPRAGGRLQHRRRPGEQLLDARGDRPVPADRGTGARLELGDAPRIGDHRWWISDLSEFRRDYPDWKLEHGRRGHPSRDLRAERRGLGRRRMKLSVVDPGAERGRLDRGDDRAGSSTRSTRRDRLRARGRRRREHRRDGGRRDASRRRTTRASAACARTTRAGFGFAVRAGLDTFTGDAVAIVMADGSDSPDDLVRYYRVLEEGYDCAFGSRFVRGAKVRDYPRFKLVLNRAANAFIRMLFRHGYNDTTNAFKAYRREVIETIQPLLSNHFNLTVEMPLKAVVRGHSFAVVPISWTNRTRRDVEARAPGDGQPLPVHRPLRLSRAPPQPRRLSPFGALVTGTQLCRDGQKTPTEISPCGCPFLSGRGGRRAGLRLSPAARCHGTLSGSLISAVSLAGFIWWAAQQERPTFPIRRQRDIALLVLAVAVYGLVTASRGWRWHSVLENAGCTIARPTLTDLPRWATWATRFSPAAAGELLRILLMADRSGCRKREVLGSIVAERLLDAITLLVLLAALSSLGPRRLRGRKRGRSRRARGRRRTGCGRGALQTPAPAWQCSPRFADLVQPGRPRVTIPCQPSRGGAGAVTLGIWCLEAVVFWLVARSVHADVTLVESLFVVVFISVVIAIPAGPGYLGTFDASLVFVLGTLDVTGSTALAIVLLYRFVLFVPVTVVGFVLLMTRYGGPEPASSPSSTAARMTKTPDIAEHVQSVYERRFSDADAAEKVCSGRRSHAICSVLFPRCRGARSRVRSRRLHPQHLSRREVGMRRTRRLCLSPGLGALRPVRRSRGRRFRPSRPLRRRVHE